MSKGFDILEKLVSATNMRHKVLSSNIANSDTPGYKSKDLDFKGIMGDEMVRLKVTDSRHMSDESTGLQAERKIVQNQPWKDENDVELDMEVAKMTENSLLHEASAQFLSFKIRQFKEALRGR